MTDTIIDLIRHGEPVGGRAFRGHNIDDPLSENGWQQMWNAVGEHCPWDQIISSPLTRCLAFARALAEDNKLDLIVEENFKEVGFGSWEGLTPEQVKSDNLQEYEDFYKDPVNKRPPGAEPLDDFCSRVISTYQKVTADKPGKQLLIVAHAGVIRAIIAHTLHANELGMYKIKVANAGITRIRLTNSAASIEFINGTL
ncbi:MAG: histidine phosphatase family protein [Gammaproteobacteria bacterium]|nr:histidine phosphatase family protein [Gammaproteobacteria bacterium]